MGMILFKVPSQIETPDWIELSLFHHLNIISCTYKNNPFRQSHQRNLYIVSLQETDERQDQLTVHRWRRVHSSSHFTLQCVQILSLLWLSDQVSALSMSLNKIIVRATDHAYGFRCNLHLPQTVPNTPFSLQGLFSSHLVINGDLSSKANAPCQYWWKSWTQIKLNLIPLDNKNSTLQQGPLSQTNHTLVPDKELVGFYWRLSGC